MKMKGKNKSRTPLKARTEASPTRVVLSDNDDEFERAQLRAARARAAASRRKSLLGLSQSNEDMDTASQARDADLLAKDQILDLFHNCIRLASENKINQRNTWELSLIDHLSDIIKVEDDDTETNFQKASCTLEAGVKIYSLRVDSVHSEAYKVLGGINRTGTGEKENASEQEDAAAIQDECDGDKSQKLSNPSITLESSFEPLNVKKFDVAFVVDPLYHQTSTQFDEGGAKGLLLNTLSVYNDCQIVFDSWDIPGKNAKSDVTQKRDSLDTINMFFMKDGIEQILTAMQSKREISPMLQEILILLDDPYRKSAEAITYVQNNDETIDSSLEKLERFDGEYMDDAFDDLGPQDFECNENLGAREDCLNDMNADSHSFAQENTENVMRSGNDEFEFDEDKDVSSERTLDYLFLGMGVSSKSNAWAGPDHWKYRKVKDAHNSLDDLNEGPTRDNKSKKKKREPFSIDFYSTSETENVALFAPPKNQRSLLLSQNSATGRTVLPEDCHYQPEEFVKLFLLPSIMCLGKKRRRVIDDSVEHMNGFETSFPWGNEDGFDPNGDDALVDSDDEDSNETMVVQPRKVQKIEVNYDKTSKQVDVHVLKRTLWVSIQDFCKTTEADNKQKSKNVMSFKGLLSNIPADCNAAAPEDISVHLCFICLLHLANEHCLSICDQPSLDELSIQIPVSSWK